LEAKPETELPEAIEKMAGYPDVMHKIQEEVDYLANISPFGPEGLAERARSGKPLMPRTEMLTEAVVPKEQEQAQVTSDLLRATPLPPVVSGARDVLADIVENPWTRATVARPLTRLAGGVITDPILGALRLGRGIKALGPAASGYFATTMGIGAIEAGAQAAQILIEEGFTPDAAEMLSEMAISALFARQAYGHAKAKVPTAADIVAEARKLQTPDSRGAGPAHRRGATAEPSHAGGAGG
jgi:hypothetical protein